MDESDISRLLMFHYPRHLAQLMRAGVLARLLPAPRCRRCRKPWPCAPWELAATARLRSREQSLDRWTAAHLAGNDGGHWSTAATRPLPTLNRPLLTRGAAYRSRRGNPS